MEINNLNYKSKGPKNPDFNFVSIKTENNTFGIFKLLITFLIILVQVAFLVIMHFYFMSLTSYYITVSVILSLITSIYIISSKKNSYSKAVWILFVLECFLFGYLIFFLSDEKVFFHGSSKKYKKIFDETDKIETNNIESSEVGNDIVKICDYLKESGSFKTYFGSNLKYYPSGAQLFDDILNSMEKAKEFIFIEFFIVSDGVLLTRFLDCLERKIKQGVEVKLIFDDMGSHTTLSRKTKKRMKEMGIDVQVFNPLISKLSVAINYRDHRKIIVVDGNVAYTGGANLADEYINEKRMHGYWKDSGIKFEGNAVNEFSLIFLRQWKFISEKNVEFEKYMKKTEVNSSSSIIVPYADGLDYKNSIAKGTYLSMIANAKQKICIMTPYFILDDSMTDLLICKAQSGVEIKIILPDVADKKMVYRVSRSNAEKLLDYGVKLYIMKNSFVHSKVLMTEAGAVVGSINFDLRSFYQQFESAVFTNDAGVLKEIKNDFNWVIKESEEITIKNRKQNNLINRMIAGILRIISPFM